MYVTMPSAASARSSRGGSRTRSGGRARRRRSRSKPWFRGGEGTVAATKVKVIDLAKELGVTSKDLMLAAEEMGHKGVRAMTPLDAKLANDLRTKLGKGRDLPEEPVKPKRVPKPKAPVELGPDGTPIKKPARAKKAKPADA